MIYIRYTMIFWIASYPKSGNTWLRALISAYFYTPNGVFHEKAINNIGQFPEKRHFVGFNYNQNIVTDTTKFWLKAQEKINSDNKLRFFKTHNAFGIVNNYSFTDANNSIGAIYIVRDPRDVVLSYANHLQLSHEETVERMFDSKNGEFQPGEKGEYNSTLTGSWSDNYNSWKSYKSSKILIIKYEDLIDNSFIYFSKIIKYLSEISEVEYDEKKINQSIEKTAFDKLRSLEEKEGFEEKGLGKYFFRSGKKGSWRSQLDVNLSRKIRSRFKKEMDELNYI